MLFGRRRKLTIAKPCRENWNAMSGGDAERFCFECNRAVHDLSSLTQRQALTLFDKNGGKLCGRLEYDERGNPTFAKERNSFERLIQISFLGASAVVSAAAAPNCDVKVRVVDATGTVVPSAKVKISIPNAEVVSSGSANVNGEYGDRLTSGTYALDVASPGFATFKQQIICEEFATVSIDAVLQVGRTGQVVLVTTPEPRLHEKALRWLRLKRD